MNRIVLLPALIGICVAATYFANHQSPAEPEMSRCVDYTDHVVDSSLCAIKPQPMLVRGTLHPQPMYRAYFGGFGSYQTGSRAWGGSDYALRGHLYETTAARQAPPQNLDMTPQPYVASRAR